MARIRSIKPAFFTSDDTCRCTPLARLLFIGLWTEADKAGRIEDRPIQLKRRLLSEDTCDVDELLDELVGRGLVRRYVYGALGVIQIVQFLKHQKPHPKEAESQLPDSGDEKPRLKTASREKVFNHPVENPSSPRRDGSGSGSIYGEGVPDPAPPPSPPLKNVIPLKPLIGKRNLHAAYEHPRFDVPQWWHDDNARALSGGDARLMKFYRWLGDRVERTNEDTAPRKEWLNEALKDWLAESAAPQFMDVDDPNHPHNRMLANLAAGKYDH